MKISQYLFVVAVVFATQLLSDAVHDTAPGRHNVSKETTQSRNARQSSSAPSANIGLNSFGAGERSIDRQTYRYNKEGAFFELRKGAKTWVKAPEFCLHNPQWAECVQQNAHRGVPSPESKEEELVSEKSNEATSSINL